MFLTQKGLEKLKEELILFKEKRKKVIERIKTAREFGDLSENSEYEDARNEQSFIEGRIEELHNMIKNAKLLSSSSNGTINLGSIITARMNNKIVNYELVGTNESDPLNGKISIESPIGHSLTGRSKGEKIEIHLPSGVISCEILEVK